MTGRAWFSRPARLERKAVQAFRLKNYRAAVRHLDELLEYVGENPNTLHVLGLCHERLGSDAAALEYATRAVAVDARHFEALRLLARLHVRGGKDGEARAVVARALDHLPPPARGLRLRRVLGFPARDHDPSLDGYDRELREWIGWARAFLAKHPH